MNEINIKEILKSKFEGYEIELADVNGTSQIVTNPSNLISIAKILKTDEDLFFEMCVDIFAIDRYKKEKRFEVVANLFSIKHNRRLFLKTIIPGTNSEMPSLTEIWKSAEWYERETYDMHGIKFVGNKDLRRIYMPDEYEYFPLRKDYPLMGKEGAIELPRNKF